MLEIESSVRFRQGVGHSDGSPTKEENGENSGGARVWKKRAEINSKTAMCDLINSKTAFILALQMHTDMGDERGIRLRCIALGRAALRGSRMRGMARCSKGSASRIARSSLSIARSSVCAEPRCLRINITVHKDSEYT